MKVLDSLRTPTPDHRWAASHEIPERYRVDPAPPGLRGEFDDLIDARYPTLSTANVGEAFPGTLTPMSLIVGRGALRVSGAIQVEMLGMRDEAVVAAQRTLAIASVGQRLYTNVSVVHAMARAMPGTSPREVDEHILGIRNAVGDEVEEHHASILESVLATLAVPAAVVRMAGAGRRVAELRQRIQSLTHSPQELRALTDDALLTIVDALHETTVDAWAYSTTTNLAASAAQTLVRKLAPALDTSSMRGGTSGLASATLLGGVTRLADLARSHPSVAAVIDSEPPAELVDRLTAVDAEFAQQFWALIDESGHRGPGETELANLMYADNPAALLDAVRSALHAPSRPTSSPADLSALPRHAVGLLSAAVRRRERCKDVAVRSTHSLRSTLREIGRRQVDAGVFGEVGDIFYLTPDEVVAPGSACRSHRRPQGRARSPLGVGAAAALHAAMGSVDPRQRSRFHDAEWSWCLARGGPRSGPDPAGSRR